MEDSVTQNYLSPLEEAQVVHIILTHQGPSIQTSDRPFTGASQISYHIFLYFMSIIGHSYVLTLFFTDKIKAAGAAKE